MSEGSRSASTVSDGTLSESTAPDIPLVVDMDGTLIRADTTHELCLLHVRQRQLAGIVELFLWFTRSKAQAKHDLAGHHGGHIEPGHLPYSDLAGTEIYRAAGHRALVSGSEHRIVSQVAGHVGGFDLVQGTEPGRNLIGAEKAAFLAETYPDGFDYVGDSSADIAVWKQARRAYGWNISPRVAQKAAEAGVDLEILSHRPGRLGAALKGMRLHQWSKNALLAVIPMLSLASFEAIWLLWLLIAFVAFGLVASATYLFNDMLDIPADRAHRTKNARPFASGALGIPDGAVLTAGLGLAGLGLATLLGPDFLLMLLGYVAISLAYSFHLKRIAILDALILSLLFCWRILAGGVVLGNVPNAWFMLALGFFFFALALGKRAIELYGREDTGATVSGRGYVPGDYPLVFSAGLASSFVSVVIVLIYALLSRSAVIERELSAILIVAILTFWGTRFWLLVGRGAVHDDPVIFALKDRLSALTLGCLMLVVLFEQLVPVGGAGHG